MKREALVAIYLASIVTFFAAGWAANGWRLGKQVADIESKVAQARANGLQENVEKLAGAQDRNDQLVRELDGYRITLNAFAQEKNREIERLTTGRRCLDGAVVRLLEQQPAQGLQLRGPVSEAFGQPVRQDGAAAPDQEVGEKGEDDYATDTDVAQWMEQCRTSFGICNSRLDALNRFYEGQQR